VGVLEGREERVVVEPRSLPPAEGGERTSLPGSGLRPEALVGAVEEREAEAGDRLVVHGTLRERRSPGKVRGREPPRADQGFEADEQRVAREGREALVR
jgi:hypothetical protein